MTAELTPDDRFRNRTVDLLFEAVAARAGGRAIGVILAGSLSDGAAGLASIRRAGGAALVQDPRLVVNSGMPYAALLAVPDAEVLATAQEIAARLDELTGTAVEPPLLS